MRVGRYELDAGKPASYQVTEESQPAGAVLGGGHVKTHDFPVPIGVDAGGDQRVHADRAGSRESAPAQSGQYGLRLTACRARPARRVKERPDIGRINGHPMRVQPVVDNVVLPIERVLTIKVLEIRE